MGIWSTAKSLAAQTPAERNRYVDFLRGVSISVVIVGHWLIATAWYVDGELITGHLLKDRPETQWLTWLFQVMPVFFIVGGYSHAVSLQSAERKGLSYAEWLIARLTRLVVPVLVLLLVWAGIALAMTLLDTRPVVIQYMSRASLVPTWFLAIYIMVAIVAPLAWAFWKRAGYWSFAVFALLAVLDDVLYFEGLRFVGWSNYFWVWLAVHQLGYAWRDDKLPGAATLAGIGVAGFAALYLMIHFGPYPLAMVGSPDEGLSNTLPPKATLIALALGQFGLLLAIEAPVRRLLSGVKLWTATVLVNSMIMTVYLWHITVMIVFGGILYLAGGIGLGLEPGTTAWWWSRPLWIAILLALLVPLALVLSPLERRGRDPNAPVPNAPRQVVGATMIGLGIAILTLVGFGGPAGPPGGWPPAWLDEAAFGLVFVGAFLGGLVPLPGRS